MAVIERNDRILPYKNIHSELDMPTLNNIVYLLRKFKKLKSNYTLEMGVINGDYGSFTVSSNLEYVNNKFRIDNGMDLNISSSEGIFPNSKYAFIFTIISEDTSGLVNTRDFIVESETGKVGAINFDLASDILDENEYLEADFTVVVVFNVTEYGE